MSEKRRSQAGTHRGYVVQVRTTHQASRKLGEAIVTKEWRDLPTVPSDRGVPNGMHLIVPIKADAHGLLSYASARALMGWADAIGDHFCSGLEFRLVKCELKYEYSVTEIGHSAPMSFLDAERAEVFEPSAATPERKER